MVWIATDALNEGLRAGQDALVFTTDESYRGGVEKICDCCGQPSRRTWSMVVRDHQPYALFFAACYDHGGVRESWIDVVFGTWGDGTDYHDHVTFGCRFGPVGNSPNLMTDGTCPLLTACGR